MSIVPKLVIFDMDDVLCHYDLGKQLVELSAMTGKEARDIRAAIWDSGFEDEAEDGAYQDDDEYLWQFSVKIGHPVTKREWIDAKRRSIIPAHEVLDLARGMSKRSRLALFAGSAPLVKENLDQLFPEAAHLFAERVSAADFEGGKPDAESFQALMQRMDVEPADTWFIDDKKAHVKAALAAGMNAHHFRTYESLAEDAANLGFAAEGAAPRRRHKEVA
jgi:glucose-1-phosphatase